jgi:hypothetical protein
MHAFFSRFAYGMPCIDLFINYSPHFNPHQEKHLVTKIFLPVLPSRTAGGEGIALSSLTS